MRAKQRRLKKQLEPGVSNAVCSDGIAREAIELWREKTGRPRLVEMIGGIIIAIALAPLLLWFLGIWVQP